MTQKRIVIAGGASADGCEIYFADGSHSFIPSSTIFGDEYENAKDGEGNPPDNWAINFPVISSAADTNISNVTFIQSDELYDEGDADEESQSAARILVRVGGKRVSLFGVYEESISCENGHPIVKFYKM